VLTFAAHAASGEYEGLDAVISAKAKGVLAEIRDSQAGASTIEDMKTLFATAKPQQNSVKSSGGAKLVTLTNDDGKSVVLTVAKEKGAYRVKEMTIND
jgi:hypothetical protein